MSTKRREGCDGDLKNSHFTSVLDVRRARSDERVVSRLDRPNPPCAKKRKKFLRSLDPQPFSADLRSRFSQQIFSADLLSRFFSRFSQQIFSANLLSRSSQQIFSCCGQGLVVSYCLIILVVYTQQISAADFLSKSSQQIFSADLLSIFSADLLSRSFAVVRGWWSAIVLSFAVVRGWWSAIVLSFAVVRGWWSAIVLSFWWSILHEFFRRTLSRSFREQKTKAIRTSPETGGLRQSSKACC